MENLTVRQFMNQYKDRSKEELIAHHNMLTGKMRHAANTLDKLDEATPAWKELANQLRAIYVEREIVECVIEEKEEENEQ